MTTGSGFSTPSPPFTSQLLGTCPQEKERFLSRAHVMLPPVVASTALRVKPTLILKRDTFIHSFIKLHWALLPGRPQVEPFTRQRPCPVELLFGGEGTGNRQIRHLSNDEDYRSRERREGKWDS